jgi:hypothetical protein
MHLCEFIEDCEFAYLSIKILNLVWACERLCRGVRVIVSRALAGRRGSSDVDAVQIHPVHLQPRLARVGAGCVRV